MNEIDAFLYVSFSLETSQVYTVYNSCSLWYQVFFKALMECAQVQYYFQKWKKNKRIVLHFYIVS